MQGVGVNPPWKPPQQALGIKSLGNRNPHEKMQQPLSKHPECLNSSGQDWVGGVHPETEKHLCTVLDPTPHIAWEK